MLLMITNRLLMPNLVLPKCIVAVLLPLLLVACIGSHNIAVNYAGENWSHYAADQTASRYSTLTQVNRENVKGLKLAWQYRSGDFNDDLKTTIECNPLIVGGVLYASTPELKLVALNAATGKEL